MNGNVGGQIPGSTSPLADDLEWHDRLSENKRKLDCDSPLKLNSHVLERFSIEILEADLPQEIVAATIATYGPDHPQAKPCQHSQSSSTPNAKPRSRSSVIADKYIPREDRNAQP